MRIARRFAVVTGIACAMAGGPLGAAAAQAADADAGAGGLLSNLSGRNSSGHANLCGAGKLSILKERTGFTYGSGGPAGDVAGPGGGILSNLLFARNASGHSNNCGNETVSVLSRTTCITVDR